MTTQASFEHVFHDLEPVAQPRVLIPAQQTHEAAKSDQQIFMDGFFGYCEDEIGIDPRDMSPEDKPAVTEFAHRFMSDAVDRNILRVKARREQHIANGESPDTAPKPPYKVPFGQVEDGISYYYREFGVNRRTKSAPLLQKELDFLEVNTRPTKAMVYTGDTYNHEGFVLASGPTPRALQFLELAYTGELQSLLVHHDIPLAADSLEVLLAAYGSWFPPRILAAGQTIIRVTNRGYHQVQRIDESNIPADQ